MPKKKARAKKKKAAATAKAVDGAPEPACERATVDVTAGTAGSTATPPVAPSTAQTTTAGTAAAPLPSLPIRYVQYEREEQMALVVALIEKDLSEPYSIFTYRYFIHGWPDLCFLAMLDDRMVGTIVCKAERNTDGVYSGYIAMLAVEKEYRKHGIGSALVQQSIDHMKELGCDECYLETEITNKGALRLYERLGFMRDVRLIRYYLNGNDAFKLKLMLK